jgi:hypothetical protein
MRRLHWVVAACLFVGQAGCGGCTTTEHNTTPKDRPNNTTPKKESRIDKQAMPPGQATKLEVG